MTVKLIARNKITPILTMYWEQSPGRAINFDSFFTIATFLKLLHYMHHFFLFGVIALFRFPITVRKMATILHCGWFSLSSLRQLNLWFSTNFYINTTKNSQKYFYLLCNSKEESRTVRYSKTQCKRRRSLKGPRRPTELSDWLDFE